MKGCADAVLEPAMLRIKDQIAASESRVMVALTRTAARACGAVARPLPLRLRQVIELAQPADPLAACAELTPIDVIIPCHSKDMAMMELVLAGVQSSSRNPINEVRLFAPAAMVSDLRSLCPAAVVESDDDILGEQLVNLVKTIVPRDRRGWIVQQLIKVAAAMASKCEGSMVLDADTVLLRERTWLTKGGVQLLNVSADYHFPYVAQAERMWGAKAKYTGLSFVTHHQLMQNDILRIMFGDARDGLANWLKMVDSTNSLSEYYCYGTWVMRNARSRVRLAQWENRPSPRSDSPYETLDVSASLELLRSRFPHAYSVSFHSYLDDNMR